MRGAETSTAADDADTGAPLVPVVEAAHESSKKRPWTSSWWRLRTGNVEEAAEEALRDPLLSTHPSSSSSLPGTPIRSALAAAASLDLENNVRDDDDDDDDDDFFPWPSSLTNLLRERLWSSDEARRYLRELIRRAGNYLAYATLLIMLMVLPKVIYQGVRSGHIDFAAYNSAGVMVLGTIVLSFRLVYLHLTHWYMPQVQKYVVRILWMVPLYAVQSWLSLRFHSSRIYIDTIRDFYEAYVIASFVYYLIELLGGEEGLVHILEGKDNPALGYHTFPLTLILEPWELGEDFMLQCKHGVLQYVVFKVVATSLTLLFESIGIYGEGQFHWMVAYPYLVVLQNVSVCYALYCLVMLYSAVDEELRSPINWRPLGKFLCVKGVVFFCWWQGVLIFYLEAHGMISGAGSRWSADDVANGLIDYCIVLEMVLFAIAHSYTFTYKEYLPSNMPPEFFSSGTLSNDQRAISTTGPLIQSGACSGDCHENGSRAEEEIEAMERIPPPTRLVAVQSDTTTGSNAPKIYRPPAVLDRPMGFTDALWSSTMPKETIEDIQRLRVGREFVVALRARTGSQDSAVRHASAPSILAVEQSARDSDPSASSLREASSEDERDTAPPNSSDREASSPER